MPGAVVPAPEPVGGPSPAGSLAEVATLRPRLPGHDLRDMLEAAVRERREAWARVAELEARERARSVETGATAGAEDLARLVVQVGGRRLLLRVEALDEAPAPARGRRA